jgi:subtilisin-like proprotein convertase family protein
MSSAPSQSPNSGPAGRLAGDRRTRRGAAPRRRQRQHALEQLEPRTLLATIPAAITAAQPNLSGGVNRESSNESSPSIAVSQANPLLLSAVWTRHDPGNLGFTPTVAIQTTVQGAFSNNGGQSWGAFTASPERYLDPTTSNPVQTFTDITDASTAFDRAGNMYVLVNQHNAGSTAGVLVLYKYDVSSGTPQVIDLNPASPSRVGKVVYEWDPTIANNAPAPGAPQAWDPILAVDESVAGFTDPSNPSYTQNNPFSGNVYVAWTAFDASINESLAPQAYALVIAASSDGGNNFKSPVVVNGTGGVRTPRVAISQGRPADPANGLAAIPGGTVSFTWDDYFSLRPASGATPPQSVIWNDHANAVLMQQFVGAGGGIGDAADPGGGAAHNQQVTTFTQTVNFTDPRINILDRLDVDLSVNHSAINELRIRLIPPPGSGLAPITLLNNQTDAAGGTIAGVGATGAGLGFPRAAQGSIGTVFSSSAATSIVGNTGGAASIGYFRPEGSLAAIAGRTAAQLSGTWTLEITDFRATTGTPLPPRTVVSWGLKFSAGMRPGVITSATDSGQWFAAAQGDLAVATTTIRGEDPNTAIPTQTPTNPRGIMPAPVIAVDNTLGAFSPNQGKTYIAYTDRFHVDRDGTGAAPNPADNTDIRMRVVDLIQTPFGPQWQVVGGSDKVNDDDGLTDGATQSFVSTTLMTGRPQYQPQVAVDPATGTLVMTWLDARDDASARRMATYLTTSIDGGLTFSEQTFVNPPLGTLDGSNQPVFDGTIRRGVVLGPLSSNQSDGNPNRETTLGFGNRQGLAVFGGKVYPAFSSNNNGGLNNVNGGQRLDIMVGLTAIAGGPRVIASTMGQIHAQQVVRLSDGARLELNNRTNTNGVPIADGFVVEFDRPVDPASFGVDDVRVFFRNPNTPGTAPGTAVQVLSVTAIDGANGNDPAVTAFERQFGATKFLVRFVDSSSVGTYSYTVGPDVNDRIRNALATREFSAARTVANLPRIPASGTGNSGTAADTVSSTISVAVPANEALTDLNVNLSIRHTNVGDLTIRLIAPTGQQILLAQNRPALGVGAGADFRDTTFDTQSLTPIAFGAAPFTGAFRPEQSLNGLNGLNGTQLSGTWTLRITDSKGDDIGVLFGWSLVMTTRSTTSAPALVGNKMDQDADAFEGRTPATTPVVDVVPGDVYAAPMPDPRRPDRPDQPRLYGFATNPTASPTSVVPLDFSPPYAEVGLPLQIPGPRLANAKVYGALGAQTNVVVPDGQIQPNLTTIPGVASSTITIGGDTNLQVTDLDVTVRVAYARPQDLRLILVAPDGTEVPLVLNRQTGGPTRGFDGTTFDDQAPLPISQGNGSFVGSYRPDPSSSLVSLAGQTLAGVWRLRVEDSVDDSTVGGPEPPRAVIQGWSLAAQTATVFRDRVADRITIRFDRDMDPNTLIQGSHIVELIGPNGPVSGPFAIAAAPNLDPAYPDPDPAHPRTYQVILPNPAPAGSYVARLASDVRSETGEQLDTNQNAGLDNLRGTPSQGTAPVTYLSGPAVPIGGPTSGAVFTSAIDVVDNFLVQDVVVQLNIGFPNDTVLEASLVAPDGSSVLLFRNLPVPGANFVNTIFDDRAPTPITNAGPPYSGRYAPQVGGGLTLGNLVNRPSAGRWELRVTVNSANVTGAINSWRLTLAQPVSNSGLGETVADRADLGFRVFTFDPTNPLSSNTWTAVGPAGAGAKGPNLNAEVAGRINAVVFDPSDPSGNIAFAAVPGGGVWKTTNFLTKDPTGPTWLPLLDDAPIFGMNIGDIAVFGRNGNPDQTVIFAATGDADATGDSRQAGLTGRGVGFLRSFDGGKTWELLDSTNNTLPFAQRDHFFASAVGQAGTTTFKLIADPNPVQTDPSRIILFAAVSDVDAQGRAVTTGPKGGVYRSTDSGNTWTRVRAGQATDVVFDPNSQAPDLVLGGVTRPGNLQFLYAAFRGDGVYFSPNQGDVFNPVLGTTGDPLIQNVGGQSLPVPVNNPSTPPTPNSPSAGALGQVANGGRIVLAKPAPTGNALQDGIYRGWLYAAVVQNVDVQQGGLSDFVGLYLTKDFGQNWTKIDVTAAGQAITPDFKPFLPTNTPSNGADYTLTGNGTILGTPFHFGNFDLSLAVDPNNPNVVYVGGNNEFQAWGLIRVDATALHDPHAFYLDSLGDNGGQRAAVLTQGNAVQIVDPLRTPSGQYYEPRITPFLNLIRDPFNPFAVGSTILVENTSRFINDGAGARWIPFDQALAPDPFDTSSSWGNPVTGVHRITTMRDPLTGQTRLVFATDSGVYSVVADRDGGFVGSVGGSDALAQPHGDTKVVNGSRNGNIQVAQIYSGAAQPSQLAAELAQLKGYFYGSTENVGTIWSDPEILQRFDTQTGLPNAGYGNLSWVGGTNGGTNRGPSRGGMATQQELQLDANGVPTGGGAVYNWRSSEGLLAFDGRFQTYNPDAASTDTFRVNDIARTFGLYQTSNQADTPDPQWPLRGGYAFAVNPIDGDQAIIGSEAGRVFATRDRGVVWAEIGNPSALDNSRPTALAFGAPDPGVTDVLKLDDFVLVGTQNGNVFVSFTGGGTGGGAGNAWLGRGNLDGSPIRSIVAEPTRGSFRVYVATERGVYRMDNVKNNSGWVNITNNLLSIQHNPLGGSTADSESKLKRIGALAVDWRYVIPDAFPSDRGPIPANAPTHPAIYVGGEGGVFRSLDNGLTWSPFPDSGAGSLLNSPLGDGGGLPNTMVTDLDLALGNIDPQTGRPNSLSPQDSSPLKDSRGPNTLTASTYGRGQFAIRLAPIVLTNPQGGQSVLGLAPNPRQVGQGGPTVISDTGLSNTDQITREPAPIVVGYGEQTAFGNLVRITLYDLTDPANPRYIGGYNPANPATDVAANWTGADGSFAIRINPGAFAADGSTDGVKTIGVQATNISGTRGNLATFNFTLDTVAPTPAQLADLQASSDTGLSNSDEITNPNLIGQPATGTLRFDVGFAADPTGANTQAALYRNNAPIGTPVLGLSSAILVEPGGFPSDGVYAYKVRLQDLAGNLSDLSLTPALNVRVDTKVPGQPSAPTLDAGSNSGSTQDNVTNVQQPLFIGKAEPNTFPRPNQTGTTPRNIVRLLDSANNVVGTGEVQSTGDYAVQPSAPLGAGTYTFTVEVIDVAGNTSVKSGATNIEIRIGTPTKPTVRLVPTDDSGSPGDNVTNVQRPRFQGTGQPGLRVILMVYDIDNATGQGTNALVEFEPAGAPTLVDITGNYRITLPRFRQYDSSGNPVVDVNGNAVYINPPDGHYRVVVRTVDVAGNFSDSDPLNPNLEILTDGSDVAATIKLLDADNTGNKNDSVTTARKPRIEGNLGTTGANALVALLPAGVPLNQANELATRVRANGEGKFVVQPQAFLYNGVLNVVAVVVDNAGNYGALSNVLSIKIASVPGDFSADGKADPVSFNRAYGLFGVGFTGPNAPASYVDTFGGKTGGKLIPIQADFDGDGKADPGYVDYATSTWYVHYSSTGLVQVKQFGAPGLDLPVPEDYDGDGYADYAVYRPTTAQWLSQLSGGGALVRQFGWGGVDRAVPGDVDGDGKAELLLYRPTTAEWITLRTSDNAAMVVQFGWAGVDIPAPADYNGDGKMDLAVYWPANSPGGQNGQGRYLIRGGGQVVLGSAGDIAVPQDYDNDGKADPAVYRPSESRWIINRTGTTPSVANFVVGAPNSIPTGAPLFPYRMPVASPTTGGSDGGGTVTTAAAGGGGSVSARAVFAGTGGGSTFHVASVGLGDTGPSAPGQGTPGMPTASAPARAGFATAGMGRLATALARRRKMLGGPAAVRRPVAQSASSNLPVGSLALGLAGRRGLLRG